MLRFSQLAIQNISTHNVRHGFYSDALMTRLLIFEMLCQISRWLENWFQTGSDYETAELIWEIFSYRKKQSFGSLR